MTSKQPFETTNEYVPKTKGVNQGLPWWLSGKDSACQCRRHKRPGFDPWIGEDPLKQETATHSSILAWKILRTEEPGGLQSAGSQKRVRHDLATEQ